MFSPDDENLSHKHKIVGVRLNRVGHLLKDVTREFESKDFSVQLS